GTELPFRRHGGRPALRRGGGQGGRHDPQCRTRRQYREAPRLSRRLTGGRAGPIIIQVANDDISGSYAMKLKSLLATTAFAALLASPALAQQITVKAGVLNDRSGLYADLSGEGSVLAARMAVEDFKAAEKGIKVEIVSADHQNKPDVGSTI